MHFAGRVDLGPQLRRGAALILELVTYAGLNDERLTGRWPRAEPGDDELDFAHEQCPTLDGLRMKVLGDPPAWLEGQLHHQQLFLTREAHSLTKDGILAIGAAKQFRTASRLAAIGALTICADCATCCLLVSRRDVNVPSLMLEVGAVDPGVGGRVGGVGCVADALAYFGTRPGLALGSAT